MISLKTVSKFWKPFISFTFLFLSILLLREYGEQLLIKNSITDYATHTLLKLGVNIIIIGIAYYFIRKNDLSQLSGLSNVRIQKVGLLIFPLIFLVLLNLLLMDKLSNANLSITNLMLFVVYCISIGFSEELSLRGFLQSHFIRFFGTSKNGRFKAVFWAALFFGAGHLLSFDKGLYGELSQVAFATFIGFMFGILLLITKRIYPLIIIHAIIDFAAKLDSVGLSVQEKITNPMSLDNSILITLLVLPCLIYGIILMFRYKTVIKQLI